MLIANHGLNQRGVSTTTTTTAATTNVRRGSIIGAIGHATKTTIPIGIIAFVRRLILLMMS